MNAYDIAKDLDREGKFPGHVCYGTSPLLVRAANMLRQQADRIERKQELIREQTALLVKQNNRIAELSKNVDELEEELLKTPQIKELSDEELWEIWDARIFTNPVGFYRTAIKKASEK